MSGHRSPARVMTGNLMWSREGTVWAIWRMSGLAYGYRPVKDKIAVRDAHTALFRSLPGESLLISVVAGLNPATVVERMIEGVDLASCGDWVDECAATMQRLDEIEPGERHYFLAVPLGSRKGLDRLTEPVKASWAQLRENLALAPNVIGEADVARRVAQAQLVQEAIPAVFRPIPSSVSQLVWLQLHSMQRGLGLDMDAPSAEPGVDDSLVDRKSWRSGVAIPEPILDEGGRSEFTWKQWRKVNPAQRRFLKVTGSDAPGEELAASYQVLLTVAGVPAEGMTFPGAEFMGRLDESGLDIDWAMRLHVKTSAEVASQNRKALINLNEQFNQREGEDTLQLQSQLQIAAEALAEYVAILNADQNEFEVQSTFILAVAGASADHAMGLARSLSGWMDRWGFRLSQPMGYQRDLWWAMLPGIGTDRVVREFAQITTSQMLAASVPLATNKLGDSSGPMLALDITGGGRPGVVHHNMASATSRDMSGSMALAAELGAGKTVTMMGIAGDVVDCGGKFFGIDRTPVGEWARWARSIGHAVVVDIANPEWSLDPLRVFGPAVGGPVANSYFTRLLNVRASSDFGDLLDESMSEEYLVARGVGGLGDWLEHLANDCELAGNPKALARKIRSYARKSYGKVLFDQSLPPLNIHGQAIIVRTHNLSLPSRDDLASPHLFEQMPQEMIFGRAMYAMLGGIARAIAFEDPNQLVVFGVDECYHWTSSPEGERDGLVFIRDGRKHNAALLLGGHDPRIDFGSATMRGLIPTRIQMRQRDRELAIAGVEWIGLPPEDETMVDLVMTGLSPYDGDTVKLERRGEGLMRDMNGSVGKIRVELPARHERAVAVLTPQSHGAPSADPQHATAGALR